MSDSQRVNRAVAWVSGASSIVAAMDIVALVLLNAFWVTDFELGVASLVTTVTFYIDLSTESNLSSVLIQRDRLDERTTSTVFWLNLIVSCSLFGAMWIIAPAFGHFHGNTVITTMLLLYSTKLVYQNLYFAPMALLRRELRFREVSIIRTIANFGDVCGKVGFAAAGEPIYCFTAGPLIRIAITGIGIQIVRPWRPQWVFQRGEIRAWLKFGLKTTASQYLQHFYNTITFQVIGAYFTKEAVGAYRIAHDVVMYPISFISNVISQVSFPAFARLRSDRTALTAQFLRFTRQNLAVTVPVLAVILACAGDFVAIVFPNVTEDSATATRILCIVGVLRAMDCLYLPLLEGVGLPGRNAGVALLTAVVLFACDLIAAAVFGARVGFIAVVIARVIGYPIVIAVHAYLTIDQLETTIPRYLATVAKVLGCGLVGVAVGVGVSVAAGALPQALRLVLVIVTTLAAVAVALDRFQGIGPRALLRGVKD